MTPTTCPWGWRPFEPSREAVEAAADAWLFFDCGACGLENEVAGPEIAEDDEFTCGDCGALNRLAVEGSYDEDDSTSYSAYVSHYICKHGQHEMDACDECEIEFGCGVGEVA